MHIHFSTSAKIEYRIQEENKKKRANIFTTTVPFREKQLSRQIDISKLHVVAFPVSRSRLFFQLPTLDCVHIYGIQERRRSLIYDNPAIPPWCASRFIWMQRVALLAAINYFPRKLRQRMESSIVRSNTKFG